MTTPMLVSGELADAPDLYQAISDELGYPVAPLLSPLDYPSPLDLSGYMVNIGLALKEISPEKEASVININAMPATYLPKPLSLTKYIAVPVGIAVIALVAFLVMQVQDAAASNEALRSQISTTNQLITTTQQQKQVLINSIDELEVQVAEVKLSRDTFQAALDSLFYQGDLINEGLKVTVDNLTENMTLTEIVQHGNLLTIYGTALTKLEVLAYATNVQASGEYSEVIISLIEVIEPDEEEEGDEEAVPGVNFILSLRD